jgi:hypothetical membrane protein
MALSAQGSVERPWALSLLLACGAVGPLLFIIVFLVEGATRPDYSAWRHFVSSLSLGPQGWVQIASFLVCGILVVCFAFGLRQVLHPGAGSTWGPILLGIFGLCLVGAGLFVTDPLLGYPPGAPTTPSLHGALHEFLSLIAFIALPAACLVLARRFAGDPAWSGWAVFSSLTAILVVVFFIAADIAANAGPSAPAGLLQRISIIVGWGWIALVALQLLGKKAPGHG